MIIIILILITLEYSDINKLFDRICTDLYEVSVATSVCSLLNILILVLPIKKSRRITKYLSFFNDVALPYLFFFILNNCSFVATIKPLRRWLQNKFWVASSQVKTAGSIIVIVPVSAVNMKYQAALSCSHWDHDNTV